MAEIVISEFMDEAAIRDTFAGRSVLYDPKLVDDAPRLLAEARVARALIVRNRTQVRGALLESATNLRVVGRLGVGLDNIDVAACEARGIAVYPASGANDLSVAEYVITAALVLLRKAWFATARVAAGEWPRTELMGRELAGKRLGLVGFGAIARVTARMGRDLGMSVAAYDPLLPADHPAWAGTLRQALPELLATSDVVSLHVPLTDATRNMIDAAAITAMKRGSILINAARGGVVDEVALCAALRAGHLGGAALDVFAREPVDAAAGRPFRGRAKPRAHAAHRGRHRRIECARERCHRRGRRAAPRRMSGGPAIYDLLVVGGGINGTGIARDAAGRGLRTLLCEQHDLAAHTSSASTKLIHGGLRYLEFYDFKLVRKSLREREIVLTSAPHICWPLRFVLPHASHLRPAWMIRVGLFLYDHLARRRILPGSEGVDLRTHVAGAALERGIHEGLRVFGRVGRRCAPGGHRLRWTRRSTVRRY